MDTVQHKFYGPRKAIDWAEKSIRKVTGSMEKRNYELYQVTTSGEIYEYVIHENCFSNPLPDLQRVILGKSFI